jgi:rhodanese-related sulfurtransferase
VLTLKQKGIDNAAALLGGLNAWKSAGYPVESTPNNESTPNKKKEG